VFENGIFRQGEVYVREIESMDIRVTLPAEAPALCLDRKNMWAPGSDSSELVDRALRDVRTWIQPLSKGENSDVG